MGLCFTISGSSVLSTKSSKGRWIILYVILINVFVIMAKRFSYSIPKTRTLISLPKLVSSYHRNVFQDLCPLISGDRIKHMNRAFTIS